MEISEWIHNIIDGRGGLHAFEHYEVAIPNIDRDEVVAAWVVRCLANPKLEGSAEVLVAIIERREAVKNLNLSLREKELSHV